MCYYTQPILLKQKQNRFFACLESCLQGITEPLVLSFLFTNTKMAKQSRVRFFNQPQEEFNRILQGLPVQQVGEAIASVGNKVYNWLLGEHLQYYYNPEEAEFATAVAAATFLIYSTQDIEIEIKQPIPGERRRMMRRSHSRSQSSVRPTTTTPVGTKADAWEQAQIQKTITRYEKIKSGIMAWENEKKMEANLKLERKKSEVEQRRVVNQKHHQNKVWRIEHIANRARAQADRERRKEETEIRKKAKEVQSRGYKSVNYCYCC